MGRNRNFWDLPVDVTDAAAVGQAVQTAQQSAPLRVAVACAGLFASTVNVNLVGSFHVLAAAAEQMAHNEPLDDDGQREAVVLTSSVAAFEGQVGQAVYSASKGGVYSLVLTAARDLASKGVRVNGIAPGIVNTPMMAGIDEKFRTELESRVQFPKRLAQPEEFAALVSTLIDSDYLNGETVRLDGGLRMPPR
ncbi:SDR family oxidoreductase [Corynebacterium propinquum]|uniref:SDR family oxidoreductase n=1 Tax=Corynebacterium propinquum TaxID=43769 RepID=UPI001F312B2C|nr:SDR family oxidoreductase [Corynebacterium propinquum]WKS28852.1 SDR family oxidoreductase [Corynebacterium propinquum]WKS35311.1 SDR family oxidoreductase [Corynebacterium propinquum]WKS41790.1 SDR family oxidoreductase [Corynebacterium propinquum]